MQESRGILFTLVIKLSLFSLFTPTTAQTCWRNTTCTGPLTTAFPGPWESNIFAPSSRTITPKSILSPTTGQTISPYPGPSHLSTNGSQLIFDFGLEVGGLITLNYTSTGSCSIGLAFTEAKNWIGEWSDSSNAYLLLPDGAIYANVSSAGGGIYVMPDVSLRGGFRYLTVFLVTGEMASVDVLDVGLEVAFQPTWSDLRAYQGYFHSDDELINRIWYSGAYTLQTNIVPVDTGRAVPWTSSGWANNGTLGPGDTIIVDGAKRDRAVWPGDMGIAVPSAFVSLGDLTPVKNALQVMYNTQNKTSGAFAESGPPLSQQGSDTYHMWTMIGTYNYILYTNDTSFLTQNWLGYQKAMSYIYDKVDSTGLLNVTGIRDWARWQQGYNNSEAQMILYRTLITGSSLAIWMNDKDLNTTWITRSVDLRTAINKFCWDDQYGAFKDNATSTTLHPQDANSMSILFSIAPPNRTTSISEKLTQNWGPIGAISPELPQNISPFITSFEIQAHFTINRATLALDLIRRSWGWYLNNPNGTESTVIEGYLYNGSFGYRGSRGYDYLSSYVSHSHGWSSGPTSALMEFVVGISLVERLGERWVLRPQFGDLKRVEGGFSTALGKFWAGWEVLGMGVGGYRLEFEMPGGTVGDVVLPGGGANFTVTVGGKGRGMALKEMVGGGMGFNDVAGGSHYVITSS